MHLLMKRLSGHDLLTMKGVIDGVISDDANMFVLLV